MISTIVNDMKHVSKCRNAVDLKWFEMLDLLKQFRNTKGHSNVPHKYDEIPSLGTWCHHQRRKYRQSTLSDWKIQCMDELGFQWDPSLKKWEAKYRELVMYKEINGHCNVSYNDKNKALARWVNTQRREYRKYRSQDGHQSSVSKRFTALENLGFIFDRNEANWHQKFEELQRFKAQHGHCAVPMDNSPLANWVSQQRRQYRKLNEGQIENIHTVLHRIKLLNKMGFIWSARPDDIFYLNE